MEEREGKQQAIFSEYFGQYIFERIQTEFSQKFLCKLRLLNKMHRQQFETFITGAHVNIDNLGDLTKNSLKSQIKYLTIKIPEDDRSIITFNFLSTKYFVNIKSVNFKFGTIYETLNIYLNEDVFFRGLNVKNNSTVANLVIYGNYDVTIASSKFDGIELEFLNNSIVTIFNSEFFNVQQTYGFICYECTSLKIDDVLVRNCLNGCNIDQCFNVDIINFRVNQIQKCGCQIDTVPILKVQNACIQNCKQGLILENSNGYLKHCLVQKNTKEGIILRDGSILYYSPIQGVDNQFGDVSVGNDCGLEELI